MKTKNQSLLMLALFIGCLVAPEFAVPALLGGLAMSFAAFCDAGGAEAKESKPTIQPVNPFTCDIPRLNDEGKWVMNGKEIETNPTPKIEPKVLACSFCGKDVVVSPKYRRAKSAVCFECSSKPEDDG